MGAAVTIELSKPVDGSDIIEAGSFEFAKQEILRLRSELGYLAQQYGMKVMPEDASDLIFGVDDEADFDRIVGAICHIRSCLRLNTQSSKRRTRYNDTNTTTTNSNHGYHSTNEDLRIESKRNDHSDDSDTSSSDSEADARNSS